MCTSVTVEAVSPSHGAFTLYIKREDNECNAGIAERLCFVAL